MSETADILDAQSGTNGQNGLKGDQARKGLNGHLTSGRLLAKNTVWNLVGGGAPMIVAVFCIPILIRGLGTSRFGVLTLAWALIGYASLFDLGLGRALTQMVAKKLGAGEDREFPRAGVDVVAADAAARIRGSRGWNRCRSHRGLFIAP